MDRIGLTGLVRIELPGHTVLLCDGGFKVFNGETYRSSDSLFGVLTSLEPMEEGVGEEVPALEVDFAPPDTAAVADLSQPGYQKAIAQFSIAEYDVETEQIIGTPQSEFLGQVDQTTLSFAGKARTLSSTVTSTAERLFERNIGNSLTPAAHKLNNPGELGHDNATGLKVTTAWGVRGPTGSVGSGSFLGSGQRFGGYGGSGSPGLVAF